MNLCNFGRDPARFRHGSPRRRPERVDKIGAAIAAADRQSRFSKRATLRP